MRRPNPLLVRPTYLDGAPPDVAVPALKAAASDACDACKKVAAKPETGLVAATLLGVTAAYFAPRFFDWALARFGGFGDDQPDEYELEYDDDGEAR
jgi:hypothetical protein